MGGMPPKRMPIKENVDPKPPAGAKRILMKKVRDKIDAHDNSSLEQEAIY